MFSAAASPVSFRSLACAFLLASLAALPAVRADDAIRRDTPARSPARELQPGKTYRDAKGYVEYQPGTLPIIITAPHGGTKGPTSIPDRLEGVTGSDVYTEDLARTIAAEFKRRTGQHVHLVINLLLRRKLDPNREITEAAQGSPEAETAWKNYHDQIDRAKAAALKQYGFAFLVDVHGHGHAIPRLELGYALDAAALNVEDVALDSPELAARTTLNDLAARTQEPFSKILRGPGSLGDLFQQHGFRAVPSPQEPQPGRNLFFAGGYTVRRHAAWPASRGVDGVQIECNRGARETPKARAALAAAVFDVLNTFLAEHYACQLTPAAATAAPAAASDQ